VKRRRQPDRSGESHEHASSGSGASRRGFGSAGRVSALLAGFRPCTRQTPRDPVAARESAVRVRKHDDRESDYPGEGALVDGRRPGPVKRFAFDEAAAEADRAAQGDWVQSRAIVARVHTGLLERTSEATSHARSAAENARIGRLGAEELSIEAPPGLRGVG